jgi:hypothetical protein
MSEKFIADNGREFELQEHDIISGEIDVEINELIEGNLEDALNLFSERLVGNELLGNMSYDVSSTHEGKISLTITGQVDMILDCRNSISSTP